MVHVQSGVELGVFIKEAMQKAGGVPFAELMPEALCAALRRYETVRSKRVAYIITKSRNFGAGFRKRSFVVCSGSRHACMPCCRNDHW